MPPSIRIKRVYEPADKTDGHRILVDRLWPRGVKKTAVGEWAKDLAPSAALRNWFQHDPGKWGEFKKAYTRELKENPAVPDFISRHLEDETITLLYGARDIKNNQAVVLQQYLSARFKKPGKI